MPTRTPNKPEAHPASKPNPIRNLSEFAVADTPGTSGPEYAAAGDYLQARFAPMSPPSQQQQSAQNQNQTNQTQHCSASAEEQEGGGMPTALERGVRGGSGPVDDTERRATRYVSVGQQDVDGDGETIPKQNENVDADGRMGDVPYAEGKVANAVEQKHGTQRVSGSSSSPGFLHGGPEFQRLHGRGRGEVSLDAGEADLER
ncbi:hypothetical protein N657DRAFT_649950 [Parathielavia appendiculata]|uniref:Uncharacterized protein n=1 Tax=Parathielavia appendiculata TaxID=2587402 RepID=A0AAN6YZS8_9PEZI|nr:hypothetical protein N657DRAFT_649950 [Parathielavia appendiculata]